MTIKSLTITENAYDALRAVKYGDESFSQVILRVTHEKRNVIDKYFGILKDRGKNADEWIADIKERRKKINKEFNVRNARLRKIGV